MSYSNQRIRVAHATNVAVHQSTTSGSYGTIEGLAQSHTTASATNATSSNHNYRQFFQMARKSHVPNQSVGQRVNLNGQMSGAPMKPTSAFTNAKRRAQMKQLLLMPRVLNSSGPQSKQYQKWHQQHQLELQAQTSSTSSNKHQRLNIGLKRQSSQSVSGQHQVQKVKQQQQPQMTMQKSHYDGRFMVLRKRSNYNINADQQGDAMGSHFRTNASNNGKAEQVNNEIGSYGQQMTVEQLKAINEGQGRPLAYQQQQRSFDVVYQPSVNIMTGTAQMMHNQDLNALSDQSMEDQAAMGFSPEKRQRSQPALPPSATKNERPILDNIELQSHMSEEYVYKSPSKMTSPEKKAFSQQLFAHDDKINAKVKLTLQAADKVQHETLCAIAESKQVLRHQKEVEDKFSQSLNKHMELTCNQQQAKYVGKPQRIIEPNLSKLFEARKKRAMIAAQRNEAQRNEAQRNEAQRNETQQFIDLPFDQLKSEQSKTKLRDVSVQNQDWEENSNLTLVNEENSYCTVDVSYRFNNGNTTSQPSQNQSASAQKPRPMSTNNFINTQNVLVTPKLQQNQNLSTKAAQAVMSRQLTMQLMPMYRIRQRSAGLKPSQTVKQTNRSDHSAAAQKPTTPVNANNATVQQPQRPVTQVNTVRVSKPVTKRDSAPVSHSITQALGATVAQAKEKASLTIKSRSKSRKQLGKGSGAGNKWLTKETNNSVGIRVRKVFMQSTNKTNNNTMRDSQGNSFAQMSKSAQGKTGFNLLTSSKENKRSVEFHTLAPAKQSQHQQRSQYRKKEKTASLVSPPQILKGLSQNNASAVTAANTQAINEIKPNVISHQKDNLDLKRVEI